MLFRSEQSMMRALLSEEEKQSMFIKFNLEGLLRGDYQSRMQGYAIGRQNGWMSANDIRELENQDRIKSEDGGDLYLVNGNMLPLSMAGAYAGNNTTEPQEETDGKILEVEEQSSDGEQSDGKNAVPQWHHSR